MRQQFISSFTREHRAASARMMLLLMLANVLLPATVNAHWLTRIHYPPPPPLVSEPPGAIGLGDWRTAGDSTTFDITISIWNNPADRGAYEEIITHFADGVYEATNGKHRIGKVHIFTNQKNWATSDILWDSVGWPCSHLNGINNDDRHIYMFDQFGTTELTDGSQRESAGYTLTHEWGHYAYALYDEYQARDTEFDAEIYMPHSTDTACDFSIMNNQWKITNTGGKDYRWGNFSTETAYTNLGYGRYGGAAANYNNTAQGRMYDASCWEVLARSATSDPMRGSLSAALSRNRFPDLADVAPAETELPRIDLNGAGDYTAARAHLDIDWMDDTAVALMIVLDKSGSMEGSPLDAAKTAAIQLVKAMPLSITNVGVVAFNDVAQVVQTPVLLANEALRDTVINAIKGISSGGSTAIGDGAQSGLNLLLGASTETTTRAVILLSDGDNERGVEPLSVIPAFQEAKVPIFAFAFGADADNVLRDMSSATGGKLYSSPTDATITLAFNDAFRRVFDRQSVTFTTRTIPNGSVVEHEFHMDTTIGGVNIGYAYSGAPGDLSVKVIDPFGGETVPIMLQSGTIISGSIAIDTPALGDWRLRVASNIGASRDITIDVSSRGKSAMPTFSASIVATDTDGLINYPSPAIIVASVSKEAPITGISVSAVLITPASDTETVALRDDGVSPDEISGDGYYSGIAAYNGNGTYSVHFACDNESGAAKMTYRSASPALDPTGTATPPVASPIVENFQRAAQAQFTIAGFAVDDHGNNANTATTVIADNTPYAGRIDFAGDMDFFKVTTSGETTLTFRVGALSPGMQPALTIYAANGTTSLSSGDINTAQSERGYLFCTVSVESQSVVYARVSPMSASDPGGGTYSLSVGATMPLSDALSAFSISAISGARSGAMKARSSGQCLMERMVGATMPRLLGPLRRARDSIMHTAAGRLLTRLYYEEL